jgi:hypothetical protein
MAVKTHPGETPGGYKGGLVDPELTAGKKKKINK